MRPRMNRLHARMRPCQTYAGCGVVRLSPMHSHLHPEGMCSMSGLSGLSSRALERLNAWKRLAPRRLNEPLYYPFP